MYQHNHTNSQVSNARSAASEERSIYNLRPWPTYEKCYPPIAAANVEFLKRSLVENGLVCPVELSIDGRILDGHLRIKALQELGINEVQAYVRHDLAGDEVALERRFLLVHLEEKAFHPLTAARLLQRAQALGLENRSDTQQASLRQNIAARAGICLYKLESYLGCLQFPETLIRHVENGTIDFLHMSRLLKLDESELTALSDSLVDSTHPSQTLFQFLYPDYAQKIA